MHRHPPNSAACVVLALLLGLLVAACAAVPPLPDTKVLIFGEQHDQPDHQRQVAAAVTQLAHSGRLGALVLEMAEQGRSTAHLPRDADAAQVRAALGWVDWDWPTYEAVVMAAVRAAVPVLGGNLPRSRLREVMADTTLDSEFSNEVRALIATAVREGHCGLLPAQQEPGMVRVQMARDRTLAQTVVQATALPPGDRRVLLLTGAQHASRDRGVPLHLARLGMAVGVHVVLFGADDAGLAGDEQRSAQITPRPDPCEGLRRQLEKPRPAS